ARNSFIAAPAWPSRRGSFLLPAFRTSGRHDTQRNAESAAFAAQGLLTGPLTNARSFFARPKASYTYKPYGYLTTNQKTTFCQNASTGPPAGLDPLISRLGPQRGEDS